MQAGPTSSQHGKGRAGSQRVWGARADGLARKTDTGKDPGKRTGPEQDTKNGHTRPPPPLLPPVPPSPLLLLPKLSSADQYQLPSSSQSAIHEQPVSHHEASTNNGGSQDRWSVGSLTHGCSSITSCSLLLMLLLPPWSSSSMAMAMMGTPSCDPRWCCSWASARLEHDTTRRSDSHA